MTDGEIVDGSLRSDNLPLKILFAKAYSNFLSSLEELGNKFENDYNNETKKGNEKI